MKVYIAGASTEIERAKRCAAALRDLGIEVTSTWWDSVEAEGGSNLATHSHAERNRFAARCFIEMSRADWIWLLVPEGDNYSHGAFAELGAACEAGRQIVCSGPTYRSIFCAMGMEFSEDLGAIAHFAAEKVR